MTGTFSNPETAGAAPGALSPSKMLEFLPLTNATGGLPSNLDVSAFQATILNVNLSLGTAGKISVQPQWQDAVGNTIPSGGGPINSAGTMTVTFGNLLSVLYRNLGPFLEVSIGPSGLAGPGLALTIFGVNVLPRFDGPYTPNAEGQVLAQSDSTTANTPLAVISYAGPVVVGFEPLAASHGFAMQYQDFIGNWHAFSQMFLDTAVGTRVMTDRLWFPPNPVRVMPASTGDIITVIAA